MIVDLVTFRIRPGRQKDFEKHNEEWVACMRRARGFVTQSLLRSLDHPEEYLARVTWVNRNYRDRFHAADTPEMREIQVRGREILDGAPASRLLETV